MAVSTRSPNGVIAGNHARARQRHVFPEFGLARLVLDEAAELRGHRAFAALRAKAQIDLIEKPAPCRHGQCGDEALGQAGVIDHHVELARAGAFPVVLVEIIDHHEVEIGTCRKLARTQTAESQNGDFGAGNDPVIYLEISAHFIKGCAHDGARDGRISLACARRRQDAGEQTRAGDEAHLARRIAGAVEKLFVMGRVGR